MKDLLETIGGIGIFIIFFFLQFPGGTIFMALACDTDKLDGWDWVLSVVIPAFGVLTGMFSSHCFKLAG